MNPQEQNERLPLLARIGLPSVFDLIVVIVFAIALMGLSRIKVYDIWWHLRTGELLLGGVFPRSDIFSFTAYGKPWVLHEWGSELIFAQLHRFMDIGGLILLRAVIVALTMGLLFKVMVRRNTDLLVSFAFTLVALFGTTKIWAVRPHLFTVLLLTVLMYLYQLFRHEGRTRVLLLMPLLFWVWINLHGGFIIGFVFLGCCLAAEAANTLLRIDEDVLPKKQILFLAGSIAVSLAATVANPNLLEGVLYPFLYTGDQMPDFYNLIAEWAASSIRESKEFIILIFLAFTGLAFSRKRPRLYEILLLIVFGYFAFTSQRHIAIFALVAIPVLATLWQQVLVQAYQGLRTAVPAAWAGAVQKVGDYGAGRSRSFLTLERQLSFHLLPVLVIAAFICITLSGSLNTIADIGIEPSSYPLRIIGYITENQRPGNLLNQYRWGGILLWRLPDRKVFIDGRMDVYKKEITGEYLTVMRLEPGWSAILNKYRITRILADKKEAVARFLPQIDPAWSVIMEDGPAVLLERRIEYDRREERS